MNHRSVTLFIFLLMSAALIGQESTFGPCCLPVKWDSIEFNPEGTPDPEQSILIVTNRPFNPEDPDNVIFPNAISDFRKVTYLFATCNQGEWVLSPVSDLFSGLQVIDEGKDILLFVHGHGKSLPQVLTRAHQIRKKYGVALVVFDWPSYNSNFNKSLARVRRCGDNYYNLLLQLKQYRQEHMEDKQNMSMLLHSLGNYYLTHQVVNGSNQYLTEKIFDNIIMNAPAVRSREHGEVISQIQIQDRLYVVYNKGDFVLRGAHLLTTGRMLGNQAMDPLAPNATYLDFSAVAGREHTYFAGYHKFEFELPAIRAFFDDAIHGREVDLSDKTLFSPENRKNVYMVNGLPDTNSPGK